MKQNMMKYGVSSNRYSIYSFFNLQKEDYLVEYIFFKELENSVIVGQDAMGSKNHADVSIETGCLQSIEKELTWLTTVN